MAGDSAADTHTHTHSLPACPPSCPPLQVSLNLLQKTGIAGAVAQLRNHRDHLVASAAEGIVAKWRAAAVSALDQATRA